MTSTPNAPAHRPHILSLRFPTGVLFDVMMRGGPLPGRYEPLGGQLMKPGPLDFTPEEAIAIRNWLAQQPEGFIDLRDRYGAIGDIERALRIQQLCTVCGEALTRDAVLTGRCRRCSA
jgi:hypothetical protein